MICVSIGRGRHKQTKAEFHHLFQEGARLIELRLDYIRGSVNLRRLIQDRPCPVIVTCRREQDGGRWEGSEESRMMLLRQAIADGVEYVDLEEDIAASVPRFGTTKRIISYHNFRETPERLEQLHEQMCGMDADVVKLATMAHNPHDSMRMLRLMRDSEIPTVGICMGDIGTPSRILAGRFGAPFTYATFHHERTLAPGQLSYRQMVEQYQYEKIDKDTELYGVIGDPIGHSMSPLIHNAGFRELGLNKVYIPFRVPREDLSEFIRDCPELGVKGLSVTIPHKEEVVASLTQMDGAVKGVEAANTVLFEGYDVFGKNTDLPAAMDSLIEAVGSERGEEGLKGRSALILGAGGVARAIAYGLKRAGVDVLIASRTFQRAEELATHVGCKAVEWNDRMIVHPHILVNCTPVGMHPNVDDSPYDKSGLRRSMVVFDTVYNPEQTLLIKEARQAKCRVVTGVEMFVQQAAHQFRFFTDHDAPIELMRETVRKTIGAAR